VAFKPQAIPLAPYLPRSNHCKIEVLRPCPKRLWVGSWNKLCSGPMRINFRPTLQTQQTIFEFLRERLEQTDMFAPIDFTEGRMKNLRFSSLKVKLMPHQWCGRIILRWWTRMLASADELTGSVTALQMLKWWLPSWCKTWSWRWSRSVIHLRFFFYYTFMQENDDWWGCTNGNITRVLHKLKIPLVTVKVSIYIHCYRRHGWKLVRRSMFSKHPSQVN
jgi:hypothetical protein